MDIRPAYQREFIYKEAQRNAVIDTVTKDYPLNVMYWADKGNGKYEVIDGQQRTISICQYVKGDFAFRDLYFHNLQQDEQKQILNYSLTIYLCSGTDSEKLEWFRTINIAGEKLTDQELRNAGYSGPWVSDAKRYFSKTACPAYLLGSKYMKGSPIRQDYLEAVIRWISKDSIEKYMAEHQHNANANELWLYFVSIINWVKVLFPKYRKEMANVPWGVLYNEHKGQAFDAKDLETKVAGLMADSDVTKKSGIYDYVITGNENSLNIRAFDDNMKREVYERQKGICCKCQKHFDIGEMEADHITPWHLGGKTVTSNCQMLCRNCNRTKSGK